VATRTVAAHSYAADADPAGEGAAAIPALIAEVPVAAQSGHSYRTVISRRGQAAGTVTVGPSCWCRRRNAVSRQRRECDTLIWPGRGGRPVTEIGPAPGRSAFARSLFRSRSLLGDLSRVRCALVKRQSPMTASDQHQPASSRAMVTFVTTGLSFRAVNTSQRWCSR